MNEPEVLTPENASFSTAEDGSLILKMQGESDRTVGVRPMFPVSNPKKFLSVHDEENEIATIADLGAFPRKQQIMVEKEIEHQYLVPRIIEIREIKDEWGYYVWDTVTDHGDRKFYVKGRGENIHSHGRSRSGARSGAIFAHDGSRMFITDIEDCKYEIPDWRKLPKASRQHLDKVL